MTCTKTQMGNEDVFNPLLELMKTPRLRRVIKEILLEMGHD